jgi:hypothetical protein
MDSIVGIKWDKLPGNHHVLRLIYPGGVHVVEFDEAETHDLVAYLSRDYRPPSPSAVTIIKPPSDRRLPWPYAWVAMAVTIAGAWLWVLT